MTYPTLRMGNTGHAVRAMQNEIRRRLGKHGAGLEVDGVYGVDTARHVARWKRGQKIQPDGRIFGSTAWAHLVRKPLAPATLAQLKLAQRPSAEAVRDKIVAEAMWGVAHEGSLHYRQVRPMADSLRSPDAAYRTDCSSFATLCYKAAGADDPNGSGYNGYGYTGTLWVRGAYTSSPKPGDLAFYGDMGDGMPSHVAVYIGGGQVASFGSEPGPVVRTLRYRGDYRGCRNYLGD